MKKDIYIYIYIYITESLWCIAEINIVNQLYCNKIFLKSRRQGHWLKGRWDRQKTWRLGMLEILGEAIGETDAWATQQGPRRGAERTPVNECPQLSSGWA